MTAQIITSDGRKLHGQAAESYAAAEERRQVAAERMEDVRAVARAVMALSTKLTGLPGPDALRAVAGRDDALRVLHLLGRSDAFAPDWEHEAQVRAARASHQASRSEQMFQRDPAHDERYVAAILAGATSEELDALLSQIVAERRSAGQAAADARAAREAAERQADAPQQRSLILSDWDRTDDVRSA